MYVLSANSVNAFFFVGVRDWLHRASIVGEGDW